MKEMKTINGSQNEKIDIQTYLNKYTDSVLQVESIIKQPKLYKKIIIKIIEKYFIFIIFGMIYFLYFLSLESCFDGEGPCSMNTSWIKKKVIQEIISSIFLGIMLQLIILKKVSKIHLIHIIIVYFFFFAIGKEWILLIMDILISFLIVFWLLFLLWQ